MFFKSFLFAQTPTPISCNYNTVLSCPGTDKLYQCSAPKTHAVQYNIIIQANKTSSTIYIIIQVQAEMMCLQY